MDGEYQHKDGQENLHFDLSQEHCMVAGGLNVLTGSVVQLDLLKKNKRQKILLETVPL